MSTPKSHVIQETSQQITVFQKNNNDILSKYELNANQSSLCQKIKEIASTKVIPEHLSDITNLKSINNQILNNNNNEQSSIKLTSQNSANLDLNIDALFENGRISTAQEFYEWQSNLESLRVLEAEEKYKEYIFEFKSHLKKCHDIKEMINLSISALDDIMDAYKASIQRSKNLHENGEQLVETGEHLNEFSESIKKRIMYFDDLEKISTEFHGLASAIDTKEALSSHEELLSYLPLLKRLDDCIDYVSVHPQYTDSAAYNSRFMLLRSRALASIKHRITQVLKMSLAKLLAEINVFDKKTDVSKNELIVLSEGDEATLLYIKFRSLVEQHLKDIFEELGQRTQKDYLKLYDDCQKVFTDTRYALLKNNVKFNITTFDIKYDIQNLIRNSFSYLLKVCKSENELYCHFFNDQQNINIGKLMQRLGIILYDILRPRLIIIKDIDQICQIIEILTRDIIQNQILKMGEVYEILINLTMQISADAKSRLTYLSQTFIEQEIGNFEPKSEDLNYPNILKLENKPGEEISYTALKIAFELLNKLYLNLDGKIFSGLAHQTVLYCAHSITKGGESVSKSASQLDGLLFNIRNLLLLREQLTYFKTDFCIIEKDLDFSHMKDHLRRILTGEIPLFSGNVSQLVKWTTPKVTNTKIDSKKGIEKQLKDNCEMLIMTVTKITVEPMLAFITKATAVRASQMTNEDNKTLKPLCEHAFASIERIKHIVNHVNNALEKELKKTTEKMKLYLTSPDSYLTLYKPIKTNIKEAHAQISSLLIREYDQSEIQKINIKDVNELNHILEENN